MAPERSSHLPEPRSPDELLTRQDALQFEADEVVADLGLDGLLAAVGLPLRVGSSALGLMVWRDIDLTVLCPRLDLQEVFGLGAQLAAHPCVRGLQFRNDTGHWNTDPLYPDGIFWGVDYRSEAGENWELDIWFIHEDTRQPDMRHLETIPTRLTPETRLAILTLKDVWRRTPDYGKQVSSYDVYTAVLDHGARSLADFERYLAAKERGETG